MKWIFVEDECPLHTSLECLVCTAHGHISIAEYHSEPEGWWDCNTNETYDVIAYCFLKDIPLPTRAVITNDNWVGKVKV